MGTERLYYTDSVTTAFQATVTAIESTEGGDRVTLATTFFYPTSGGQMHDLGILGGCPVVDVVDEGEEIVHCLDGPARFAVGDEVHGEIDSIRRAHHRQQHTGQHVLSRVLEDRFGLATESSRLGETGNTLDVAGTQLSTDDLDTLERACQEIFRQARPVHVHLLDVDEAAARGLRKKVERAGPVRVIEVEGVDSCACGGTHVSNTAEIASIALSHLEKVRGGQRIHFLCGLRAEEARRRAARSLHTLATELTTGTDQLVDAMRKLKSEVKDAQRERLQLAQRLVRLEAARWLETATRVDFEGHTLQWVHHHLDEHTALAATAALKTVTTAPATIATFTLVDHGRGQLLVGRSADVSIDCREFLARALEFCGGRGGGQPDQARGGFKEVEATEVASAIAALLGAAPDASASES